MGITSYQFVFVFLPITLIGWKIFLNIAYRNHVAAVSFLSFMSLLFIGSYDYRFIITMLVTVIFNYYSVNYMNTVSSLRRKRMWVTGIVLGNLGVLLVLKYAEWIGSLFMIIDKPWNLILPIGISFYTLEQIMYAADSYKEGSLHASFSEYLLYSVFFPVIVSGPIWNFKQYKMQLEKIKEEKISDKNLRQGLLSFSIGLAKKVLAAAQLEKLVDFGYGNISEISAGAAAVCVISYSLQLYFDFSGYCNMAEGMALMMGFHLPINFSSPYQAASILEFWKRWHITLTNFFTRYLYIPLGGNRKGRLRWMINTMAVFFISGLWHGASATYFLWGGVHGIFMILNKYAESGWNKIWLWLRKGICFMVISLLWIPFRADSLKMVKDIFLGIGSFSNVSDNCFYQVLFPEFTACLVSAGLVSAERTLFVQKILMGAFISVLLIIVFLGKDVTYIREKYCDKIWMAFLCGLLSAFAVMGCTAVSPGFIYEGF